MKATFVVLIAFAVLFSVVLSDPVPTSPIAPPGDCGPHKTFSTQASPCEPQCNNFRGEKCPAVLTRQLVFQCVCDPGYLRIENDDCVPEDSEECGGRYVPPPPSPQ